MPTRVTTEEAAQLVESGAQLVDVLPASTFAEEHLPGAISLPMDEIASAPQRLDMHRPVVVYCYDHQCDLSSRAAARLVELGFREVYDYVDSKVAWLADGRPSAGRVDDAKRAISRVHRDLPTVRVDATLGDAAKVRDCWEVVAVVDADDVVMGVVRGEADDVAPDTPISRVMQPAPPTVRPSIPLRELAETMDDNGERYLLVTTHDGRLLGLVRRSELDAA